MKTLIATFAITLGVVLITNTYATGQANQFSQTCGANGIVIRPDGSLVIDSWKDFSLFRSPNVPPIGAQFPASNPGVEAKDMPTKVLFGKSLPDSIIVCFEETMETHCVTLGYFKKVRQEK